MKRLLTTLVALVVLIGTAWCAPVTKGAKVDVSSLCLRENVRVTPPPAPGKLTSKSVAQSASPQGVLKRLKAVGSDGTEWEMTIQCLRNRWCDIFNGDYSFEEMPYYLGACSVSKLNEDGTVLHSITLPLFWPVKENTMDPASFDDILAGADHGLNLFSTKGILLGGETGNLIWPNPQQIFVNTINGAQYWEELLSQDTPTTLTITSDGNGGYNVTADVQMVQSNLIGVSELKVTANYPKAPNFALNNFPRIYLVGEPQGWDINNNSIPVEKTSEDSRIYGGSLFIPSGKFMFRFYGDLSDWSSWSIGSQDYDDPIEIGFDGSGLYNGPLSEGEQYSDNGKGAWSMPTWTGGRFYANVDLDAAQVSFRKMQDPDAFYPVFYQSDVNVNTADYPLKRVSENIYEGIVEVPAELLGEGNVINLLFSDNSGNTYVNTDYVLTSKNGENLTVGRVERNSEINCTVGGYVFAVQDYKGTRLKVSIDLMTGFVRFSNPDVAPVTPEEVELQFAPDTPETLVFGELTDITVTYPEGVLDEDENYVWQASDGGYIREIRCSRIPGKTVFTVRAEALGEWGMQVGSNLGDQFGIEALERRFNVVAPDYAQNGGEEITLKGRNLSGDYSARLAKKEPGIYTGTVDLDGQTIFRVYVPTANGEVALAPNMGGGDSWEFESQSGSESFSVRVGDESSRGQTFELQNVTEDISNEDDYWTMHDFFLGSRYVGQSELTVDLNTMMARLSRPDFKPYITVDKSEIKVLSESEFSVIVKSNVGDDLSDGSMIRIDNPEVASFDRIERQDDETFRYVFRSGNIDGETKIHITSPMLEEAGLEAAFTVTVTTTVNPEDIQLSFAPDTPETVVCGTPVDITVTYPEGWLDNFDLWIDGGFDELEQQRNPGMRTYRMIAQNLGQVSLSVGSELHERLGLPRLERTFECVSPDYAQTAGEEIILNVRTNSGESNMSLSKKSEGVYGTTVNLNGETLFRISVPTANGDVVLGGYRCWDGFDFNGWFIGFFGGNVHSWGTQYTLQEVTDVITYDPDGRYLGTRHKGEYELTVDLNTMTATLRSADFKPYITVEQPEMKVRRNSDFIIRVKTNVNEDVYEGENNGFITVDNPGLMWLNWLERIDDETFDYHFYAGEEFGTTTVHISSPLLREAGLEATVEVNVADLKTESLTLSSPQVTVRQGEYAYVSCTPAPYQEVEVHAHIQNEGPFEFWGMWDNRFLILAKEAGEQEVMFTVSDNEELTAVLKVTVLPADAKVAEHIVYTELEPEQRTRLYLDEHQDGSEAAPAWSSSDESVATVDADGRVTALKAGRAVITADCGAHQVMAGIHVKNSTDVDEVSQSRVNVYSQGTAVTVVGTEEGDTVSVFAADGSLMTSRRSDGSALRFDLGVRGAFVVTAGSEIFKVVL